MKAHQPKSVDIYGTWKRYYFELEVPLSKNRWQPDLAENNLKMTQNVYNFISS